MSDLKQKVTLRLSTDVMQTAQEAVSLGIAPNATVFIEESIRARAREVRHARMRQLAQEAMADPDFVADMRDTIRSFEAVTGENWPDEKTSIEAAA